MPPRRTVPRGALALLVAAFLCACATGGGRGNVAPPPQASEDAGLGPGDSFEVTVYGQEDLSGKYKVAPGGSIDFPLVGEVAVAGLDQTQIARALEKALRDGKYLLDPQVSVIVLEMDTRRVTVVGAVNKPGSFVHTRGMTLVHAISLAGGLNSLAAANDTILTRQVEGQLSRTKIPVERITEGRHEDPLVHAGDIIYVPERIF